MWRWIENNNTLYFGNKQDITRQTTKKHFFYSRQFFRNSKIDLQKISPSSNVIQYKHWDEFSRKWWGKSITYFRSMNEKESKMFIETTFLVYISFQFFHSNCCKRSVATLYFRNHPIERRFIRFEWVHEKLWANWSKLKLFKFWRNRLQMELYYVAFRRLVVFILQIFFISMRLEEYEVERWAPKNK